MEKVEGNEKGIEGKGEKGRRKGGARRFRTSGEGRRGEKGEGRGERGEGRREKGEEGGGKGKVKGKKQTRLFFIIRDWSSRSRSRLLRGLVCRLIGSATFTFRLSSSRSSFFHNWSRFLSCLIFRLLVSFSSGWFYFFFVCDYNKVNKIKKNSNSFFKRPLP